MMRIAILVLFAILPLMHGCAPVIVGGAAATSIMVAHDRRTVGAITEDAGIEVKIANRIGERIREGAHINITSFNRVALLTGEVPSEEARVEVERIARSVDNVRGVYNETAVAGVSSGTVRANDGLLTTKVKGRFLDAQKFNPLHVKVVTENSVVYLLGLVTKQEADEATEIARTTGGVQKVVRLLEYLD